MEISKEKEKIKIIKLLLSNHVIAKITTYLRNWNNISKHITREYSKTTLKRLNYYMWKTLNGVNDVICKTM